MDEDKLRETLRKHKQWLDNEPGGNRADLRYADLRDANLQGADLRRADLRRADLDYSCWPLWCGSLDVKVDARIARQLAYHFCRLDCDDPEYRAARESMKDFANQFHRAKECGEIHGEQTKKAGTPASE